MFLFEVLNLSSDEVIELFEDVEGIIVEIYSNWSIQEIYSSSSSSLNQNKIENKIYYQTNDKLIQPILKSKQIKIGKQSFVVKECKKIKVKSLQNEQLDISVVLRVLLRSCGLLLVQYIDNDITYDNNDTTTTTTTTTTTPNNELIFYCPDNILNDLCNNEHKVKGKLISIEPYDSNDDDLNNDDSNKNIDSNHFTPISPSPQLKLEKNISQGNNTNINQYDTSNSYSPSSAIPSPNQSTYFENIQSSSNSIINDSLQEVNSICILHDGQSCPIHNNMTSKQLYESILQLVWRAMTGKNDKPPLHVLQKSISIKWNLIQSSLFMKEQNLTIKDSIIKEFHSLGGSIIDPGPHPVDLQKTFIRILSENLSFCLSRSSHLNINHVILFICNNDRDYIDVVRSLRLTGAKVMLIYSNNIWNDILKQYEYNNSSNSHVSMVGLKVILPRNYVLGIWEEIFPKDIEKKVLDNNNNNNNNVQNNSLSNSTTISSSSSSSLTTTTTTTITTTTLLNNTTSNNSSSNTTISPLKIKVEPKSIRDEIYDSKYDSNEYKRKRSRSRSVSPIQRRKTSSYEPTSPIPLYYGSISCSWCLDYFGIDNIVPGNSTHSNDQCWFHMKKKGNGKDSDHCKWCLTYYDKRSRHNIHNCWHLECSWCLKNLNEKNFHHFKNCPKKKLADERERERQIEKEKARERTKEKEKEKKREIEKAKERERCISIQKKIDDKIKYESLFKNDNNQNIDEGDNNNNNNNDNISNNNSSEICTWCLKYLSMKGNHHVSCCKYKKWNGSHCLWCLIYVGVKLFHNLKECPNRKERMENNNQLSNIEIPQPVLEQRKKKIEQDIEKMLINENNNDKVIPQDPRLKYFKDNINQIVYNPTPKIEKENNLKNDSEIHQNNNNNTTNDDDDNYDNENNNTNNNDNNDNKSSLLNHIRKSESFDEKKNNYCEWCWNSLQLQNYHDISNCPHAPKPKRNDKPSSNDYIEEDYEEDYYDNYNYDENGDDENNESENNNKYENNQNHNKIGNSNLEEGEQEEDNYDYYNDEEEDDDDQVNKNNNNKNDGDKNNKNNLDEDMSFDEESYCLRCWDKLGFRRYHTNEECPDAPKPKSNQKPTSIIVEETSSQTQLEKPQSKESQQQQQQQIKQNEQKEEQNNNNNNSTTRNDYCALCWEYHRQRKYHDHPNDCRTTLKIKKKFKSYIK